MNTKPIFDFTAELFKRAVRAEEEKKDLLLSPFSVFSLLTILADGAKGDTKRQMEGALGTSTEFANQIMRDFRRNLLTCASGQLKTTGKICMKRRIFFPIRLPLRKVNVRIFS